MSLITILEDDVKAGWHWIETEAKSLYEWAQPLLLNALKAVENVAVSDFWGAVAAFVQKAQSGLSLADLETAFLNTVQLYSGNFIQAAIAIGSQLLQTILGAVLAHAKAQTA